MDLTLTEEQLGFQRLAREFLDEEVVPYRTEWDRRESVDPAIIPKLGELGFFGLTIPEEYGGLGGDYVTYCLGMEELGRADSAVRGIVSVSMGRLQGRARPRHGGTEAAVASGHRGRHDARLLRAHRTRQRVRRRQPADARRPGLATTT
jgi:alkylation response protein AidB-like acyl-CoA dehydrogenase